MSKDFLGLWMDYFTEWSPSLLNLGLVGVRLSFSPELYLV